jgi:polysaccharide biosynthesis protein PslG
MRYRLLIALIMLFLVAGLVSAQEGAIDEPAATDESAPTDEVSPTDEVIPTEVTQPTDEVEPTTAVSPTAPSTNATVAPTTTSSEPFTLYIVRRGDTLGRIATRFNTTVNAIARLNGITNINLIITGQELRIPTSNVTPTSTAQNPPTSTAVARPTNQQPTPTAPADGTVYIVRSGDTLFRIAVRFNTTVANLVALNNLSNPNLIYTGQRLIVSGIAAGTPVPTGTGTAAPATGTAIAPTTATTGTAAQETQEVAVDLESFDYGVTAFLLGQNVNEMVTAIGEIGVNWVRVEVYWSELEPAQGEIDYGELDTVVEALEGVEANIMLVVSSAPDWARTSLDEDGPPDDFATFDLFITALATRYSGRIDAYQIWSEPNLRREWNSDRYEIRADHYVDLLRTGYEAINEVDPDALVIAAGLAPTGFNDGINAIDDRTYLQDMYSNGVISVSDAVAAHPGGWSNPPDSECCTQPAGVETHYESPTFFFKDTLEDYREIMLRNNDNRPLWVTKFGWGTSEDTSAPGADYVYITYTDLAEQAIYTPRAFEIGSELGYIGPMFLYNLNGCTAQPARAERCYTSLIAPDGSLRPVFSAVASLDKSDAASED